MTLAAHPLAGVIEGTLRVPGGSRAQVEMNQPQLAQKGQAFAPRVLAFAMQPGAFRS